jgi:hypothetical protein
LSPWLYFNWNELGELTFDDGCMARWIYIQEWTRRLGLELLIPSYFGFESKQILRLEKLLVISDMQGSFRKFIRWKR